MRRVIFFPVCERHMVNEGIPNGGKTSNFLVKPEAILEIEGSVWVEI